MKVKVAQHATFGCAFGQGTNDALYPQQSQFDCVVPEAWKLNISAETKKHYHISSREGQHEKYKGSYTFYTMGQ